MPDDGDDDMLFRFSTQQLELDEESVEALLVGEVSNGMRIKGSDAVRIVPRRKRGR